MLNVCLFQGGVQPLQAGTHSFRFLRPDTDPQQMHLLRENTLVRGGTLQADALIIGYDYDKGVEIPVQRISCYGRLK